MILLFNLVTSFKASTRLVTTHRATNRHLRFGPFQGHLEQRFSGTCRATFENMTEKWKPMEWTTASAGLPLCGFYSFQMMAIPCNTFRKKELTYWNMFEDRNFYFTHSGTKLFKKKFLIMFQNLFLRACQGMTIIWVNEWVVPSWVSEWVEAAKGQPGTDYSC